MVLKKILDNPLDCKEIKPVNPEGNQPWRFLGRTNTEAEAPILWLPDAKSQLIRKDPDAGKVPQLADLVVRALSFMNWGTGF